MNPYDEFMTARGITLTTDWSRSRLWLKTLRPVRRQALLVFTPELIRGTSSTADILQQIRQVAEIAKFPSFKDYCDALNTGHDSISVQYRYNAAKLIAERLERLFSYAGYVQFLKLDPYQPSA